ncbi:hypothetical protein VTI74DRAFT_1664 [Chaetomium olivicolor]
MRRRGFALWAASLAAVHTAASAVPMSELFARQSSCYDDFKLCNNANFPDYFCCPPGQRCIALAGNTTLLCCPSGGDCQRIEPLPCDLSLQDGEKNPDAVIKTTALGGTLARCGDSCCPFGYSCRNNACIMDENQNVVPIQTNTVKLGPTSTRGPRTSATTRTGTSPTADATNPVENPATTTGASEQPSESGSGPSVAAVAGGVVAGVIGLIGLIVLAIILLKKKKGSESGSPPKLSRSSSSFGDYISNPIMAENTAIRTDFTRAQRQSRDDPGSVTGAVIDSSVNSPDSAGMSAPRNQEQQNGIAYGGYGNLEPSHFGQSTFVDMPYINHDSGLMPQTPRQNREPSSVSINVFADPTITPDRSPEGNMERRYSNVTTFTQMLDRADLGGVARGESYVPNQQDGGYGSPPMPMGRRLAP